jgi:membrane protease YdiL (CAAX protease family)
LALPAFLITAATDGRAGVRDLLRRTSRWRVGIGWYLLAMLAIPVGALLLAPLFLGPAPLQGLLPNWILPFTEFVPQLLLALMTVQFFEELGCAGFVQHRLQSRHGALNASFLVALAFAFLHLPLPECADLRSRRPPGLVGDGDRERSQSVSGSSSPSPTTAPGSASSSPPSPTPPSTKRLKSSPQT